MAITAMMMTINKEKGVALLVLHNTTILPHFHTPRTNIIIIVIAKLYLQIIIIMIVI